MSFNDKIVMEGSSLLSDNDLRSGTFDEESSLAVLDSDTVDFCDKQIKINVFLFYFIMWNLRLRRFKFREIYSDYTSASL